MRIRVIEGPFNPWDELAVHESTLPPGRHGAACAFVGTMRDFNEGSEVTSMCLEHYPGMTERQLESLAVEAMERWRLEDVVILHRVGNLHPGDPIVLVATWSSHRAHAFEASRQLMEDLKHRATFWKKEVTAEGDRWVENNTSGRVEDF